MKYQAVIFDLDGVLCHTDEYHYRAWKSIADALGAPFDREINNRLRGVSRMASLEIILKGYRGHTLSQEEKEHLASEKNTLYRSFLEELDHTDLDAEVPALLDALKALGVRLAVGSSSRNAPLILSRLELEGYFDAVVDGNAIARSKPDPEVFVQTAKRLGLPHACCLVVEDAEAGIRAAAAGGFDSAGIGEAAKAAQVVYPLRHIRELINIVKGE